MNMKKEFLYKVGDLLQDIEGDLVLVEDAAYNPMSTVPWHYKVREFQGATYHVGKGTLENIELFKKVA